MQWKTYAGRLKRIIRARGIQRSAEDDFSVGVPFRYQLDDSTSLRIAGICHIYFTDLASEMLEEFKLIPYKCDLYISTDSDEKRSSIERVFSNWEKGSVEIRLVENRGRDIAPKIVSFTDIYSEYDLLIFTHSKKSNSMFGPEWRKFLANNLFGSPQIVKSVVEVFDRFPSVGMVISQHYAPIREGRWLDWGNNYWHAKRLARQMGIKIRLFDVLDFPSGSMFWARPDALTPLLALGLCSGDFPVEKGQIDGTIAHAIERLFLYGCERAGFIWLKVANPLMFKYRSTIKEINEQSDLDAFIRDHVVRLMRSQLK